MKKILIIEDDSAIAEIEKDYLTLSGLDAAIITDGKKGLEEAQSGLYDLILLDLMLPGTDGFSICRRLREQLDIPILIVSARRDDIDKIRSLGFGADDYIEKPFSSAVLAARVKSQLARYERLKGTAKKNTGIITIGDITLNPSTRIVTVRGENKLLPNKEFQLLEFLMIKRISFSAGKPSTTASGAWNPSAIHPPSPSTSTASGTPSKKTPPIPSIF